MSYAAFSSNNRRTTLEGVIADPSQVATKENLNLAIDSVRSILRPAESKNVPEEVDAFREAFDNLLKEAKVGPLIVLIDALDRCRPDTAIETLEAIRFANRVRDRGR